ncbi:putative sesquipedalian [Monocercomonoides exilis]|uniref:putative sesquipedalian n=1 Tax=Monocercomonoides exilis TaxID=2049356 RepID=UPI0035599736|nr:putative sesquipedalian [Monocercomonoides exilis]|eukprot:MONOS_12806.1-p1 / transcript=MONOS_12806.1 / gene=MONOS_12806 / organism=Monocercomonoides_exilis_PA203 / gene_product=unspecified product / transcript_product=unspecified product / location=Mono_scaffold00735:24158-24876(-) / protein_length=169 / sequence_SO=supercontig / SO=protein_coding / is_pseudo=false
MSRPKYQANFDFTARVANELTFREGDIITLIEKHESGMWKGELDGKIGLFPYNFVSELHVEEETTPKGPPKPMEGWLIKQGHVVKNWKKRWFSLRGSSLFYFEKPTSLKENGEIPLKGCQVENAREMPDKPFCFHIFYPQAPGQREFYICSENADQMKAWMEAITLSSK